MTIKQKICLVSGLILIIVILLFWGIVKPLLLEVKVTSASVKERNEKLSVLQKTDQEYLKELEIEYNNVKEKISLMEVGFLEIDKVVDFFVKLESIATNTSNQIEIEPKEFPVFNLDLTGSFPNLIKFLGWLENGDYFLDVETIKIKRLGQRDLTPEQQKTISIGDVSTVLRIRNYIRD